MKACIGLLMAAALGLGLTTPVFGNLFMLLMDRDNFIPAQSSVFTFEPYQVSQGSSNYWLYGEDEHYYYHFTYLADVPYLYIPRKNTCAGFDRADVRTWCSASRGIPH